MNRKEKALKELKAAAETIYNNAERIIGLNDTPFWEGRSGHSNTGVLCIRLHNSHLLPLGSM